VLNDNATRVAIRRPVRPSDRMPQKARRIQTFGLGTVTINHDPGIMVYARRYFTS
jgi:hypothetical protein